jgi:glycosyltransferase involved in cell wall biosynthesis
LSLLFLGAINEGNVARGGEEYKNQMLYYKLKLEALKVEFIDTHFWLRKPMIWFKILLNVFLRNYDSIIISASSVSTYRLLRIIRFFRPSILNKITYLVVGGYFPQGIKEKKFDWKVYKNLKNIVVQGNLLKNTLLGHSNLNNVKVLPNFKSFTNFKAQLLVKDNIFRFVYVGRISKSKGIGEILEAISLLKAKDFNFHVTFYGPVEDTFKLESSNASYGGILDIQSNSNEVYAKLSTYNVMLFPTYWKGEGFPGVLIDAFIAGLPVIATDWNMNKEIIEEGINGFLIEPKSTEALVQKMIWVMENRSELDVLRLNNLTNANKYHIDTIWQNLINYVLQ